jgi:hypothetical protein
VIELNRAVAHGYADGPAAGLFRRAAAVARSDPERRALLDRADGRA